MQLALLKQFPCSVCCVLQSGVESDFAYFPPIKKKKNYVHGFFSIVSKILFHPPGIFFIYLISVQIGKL